MLAPEQSRSGDAPAERLRCRDCPETAIHPACCCNHRLSFQGHATQLDDNVALMALVILPCLADVAKAWRLALAQLEHDALRLSQPRASSAVANDIIEVCLGTAKEVH